jgi:arginyl-tRNA synthetase
LAKFGNGQTPESTGLKGDKLVGNYMLHLIKLIKEEIAQLMSSGKNRRGS